MCVCVCVAGLVKREHSHTSPSDKPAVSSSLSVFSRLDGKSDTSPVPKTYTPSSTSTPSPVKRTIVTATSPSPKKLRLHVTAKEGRRVSSNSSKTSMRSSSNSDGRGGTKVVRKAGTKREVPGGGLVSSSSSFASRESAKSRLSTKMSGEHIAAGRGGGGDVVIWPDAVSTSIATISNSGRVSTRLGGGGGANGVPRELLITSRKARPTMIADSASNSQPKASARLGTTQKSARDRPTGVLSAGTIGRRSSHNKPKTSPTSMVADEYELKRQLDIRSRLAEREKQVEERRSGPLRGRLGQHRVFQRLT